MAQWIWTIALLTSLGILFAQLQKRFTLLWKARTDDFRNYSQSTWKKRLENTLVYAFGQKKFFLGEQPAGWMHVLLFWGFVVLLLQVITMFVRGWIPDFYLPGLSPEGLGGPYGFLKDLCEVGVLIAASVGLYRWGVSRPQRLMGILPAEAKLRSQSHWEAFVILLFIVGIMVSGLLYDAGRFVALANEPDIFWEKAWQPVSLALSRLFSGNIALAETVSQASWWIHNGIILVFVNLLPRSKHFHIITAIPNVFFGKVEPFGRLPKKNFEAEGALFGRSQPIHFTRKQVLDMYSCTECGRCSSVCPATATGKTLAPRQFLVNLRDTLYADQQRLIKRQANGDGEWDVVVGEGKAVIDDVIWSCNACRACEEACPVNIEYIDKIVDIRQHLVQEAARFPNELSVAFRGLENQSNPWGISSAERDQWAQGLEVPKISEQSEIDYLYYVGCGGSFDKKNQSNSQSLVKILKSAGVRFAIMGSEELCNGETARRLGNEYLYQTMAEALVAKIQSYGVKKILVNCPHCFNTFANEYPDFGAKWEVIRAADLVRQLVIQGKITMKTEGFDKRIVYHDSCYYGRMNQVYEEPRDLLKSVPGVTVHEVPQSRANSMCCGAGGGRMWLEEDKNQRVNIARTEQLLTQNPDVIATSCPFCKIMVGSAVNEKGMEKQVKVMDVMEVVSTHMVSP